MDALQFLIGEKVDIVGRVDRLRHSIYLVRNCALTKRESVMVDHAITVTPLETNLAIPSLNASRPLHRPSYHPHTRTSDQLVARVCLPRKGTETDSRLAVCSIPTTFLTMAKSSGPTPIHKLNESINALRTSLPGCAVK